MDTTMTIKKGIIRWFLIILTICLLVSGCQTPGSKNFSAGGSYFKIDIYDPQHTYSGTTLFADNSRKGGPRIVEVDMNGNLVWEYTLTSQLFRGKRGRKNIVMDVERLPNGNTLFNIQEIGTYEVNQDKKVVWKYFDSGISHDVDRLPNSNTLFVRGWSSKGESHILEVTPEGKVVWSWNGLDEFDRPPYANIYNQGWIHVNAVTRLDNGNTLISLRNFNMIVEVSPQGNVVWSRELGKALTQKKNAHPHEPEVLPNGNILVALTGANVVLEFRREGGPPVWKWRHPTARKSVHIRDVNRLPNGNTLIVEADKIIELSPTEEIVWQLRVPAISKDSRDKSTFLFKAQRLGKDGSVSGH